MSRHPMGPADLRLVRWAQDAQLSPDASRVAWSEIGLDVERDEPVTCIMVAPATGDGEPRRFSDGPHDFSPRWSSDGRHLAYLAASDAPPALRIAPLDGGAPIPVGAPGPVRAVEWSPTGDRLLLTVKVVERPNEKSEARAKHAPRVIRGLFNRLDGEGWLEGRNHLFVYEIASAALRQLTRGDYDHAYGGWSPDGSSIAFVSDRSRQRDDRVGFGDVWVAPTAGGKPQRVAADFGEVGFPTFSPDGARIAFTGLRGAARQAGRDVKVFVVDSDGTGDPTPIVPGLDRPLGFTFGSRPLLWLSLDELLFTVADAGGVEVRRARLKAREAHAVVAGDLQVAGLSVAGSGRRRVLAFCSAWGDAPSEVFTLGLENEASTPVRVSRAGDALRASVELLPLERHSTHAPDGTPIEYFVIRPRAAKGRSRTAARPPMFLEVHGGPHMHHPFGEASLSYQVLAGAGYLVVLPNPRGSTGYGEEFTGGSRGEWGTGDFDDVMACADDVLEEGLADPERQFVGGYSYGGFMSAWIVGHTNRFKAATIGAPVIDLVSEFGTWDAGLYFADALAADPWTSGEHLRFRSPVEYAAAVRTPVFLYVYDEDLRCPPSQADEFYVALKWHGQKVEYVRYPGGSHSSGLPIFGPPSQSEDRLVRILEWLGQFGGIASGASTKHPASPTT